LSDFKIIHFKIVIPAWIHLISKMLQLAPSYWHGCRHPVTWMWMYDLA